MYQRQTASPLKLLCIWDLIESMSQIDACFPELYLLYEKHPEGQSSSSSPKLSSSIFSYIFLHVWDALIYSTAPTPASTTQERSAWFNKSSGFLTGLSCFGLVSIAVKFPAYDAQTIKALQILTIIRSFWGVPLSGSLIFSWKTFRTTNPARPIARFKPCYWPLSS